MILEGILEAPVPKKKDQMPCTYILGTYLPTRSGCYGGQSCCALPSALLGYLGRYLAVLSDAINMDVYKDLKTSNVIDRDKIACRSVPGSWKVKIVLVDRME